MSQPVFRGSGCRGGHVVAFWFAVHPSIPRRPLVYYLLLISNWVFGPFNLTSMRTPRDGAQWVLGPLLLACLSEATETYNFLIHGVSSIVD